MEELLSADTFIALDNDFEVIEVDSNVNIVVVVVVDDDDDDNDEFGLE
jgi:hypothetical protein